MDYYGSLLHRLESRSASIAVIGLGYVGLPLAVLYAGAGFRVTGIERNPQRVEGVNRGRSYIEEVPEEALAGVVRAGRLEAASSFEPIASADVVAICVPTPIDEHRTPDLYYLRHVLEQGGPYWHPGQLVVLESTSYPGTTEEVVAPALASRGLRVGEEVFVAFAPERIDPGNRNYRLEDIPRVVGGLTPRCTRVACTFYRQVLRAQVVPVSSPRVAEMTKLFENVFRVVNVSLVNEMARLCERMGVDVWEVIEAARTKPYGFMPFYPGPGVGGHCIPIDPFYLSWKAREYDFVTRFIELAGEINDQMPDYVVQQCAEALNRRGKPLRGSRVLLLGVAFKRDVADTRESAALKVARGLMRRGAQVSYHDPYVSQVEVDGTTLRSLPLTPQALREADLVVVTTDHSGVDYGMVAEHSPLVYDTRNALSAFRAPHILRLGAPPVAE